MTRVAITRHVSAGFANALCASPPASPIDLALARTQHASYREQLARLGLEVIELAADHALPDCCFIEDTAVVAEGVALVTRPGATSRQAETPEVARALKDRVELAHMVAPAALDGGDCMRVGRTIYVGRSARTNAAGIAMLRDVFEARGLRIVAIDLPPEILHLKCVCAPLGDDRITLAAHMPRAPFAGLGIVEIPHAESYAANVLAVGSHVLVAEGYPRTADALSRAGFEVVPIATTEFHKADGALTCLSLLLD